MPDRSQELLPTDMMTEVLSRLPPKIILRFGCVCKSWLALFTSPDFIKAHLNRSIAVDDNEDETLIVQGQPQKSLSLLRPKSPNTTFNLNNPTPENQIPMEIVGSINGIVCLSFQAHPLFMLLWNPVAKQFKKISHPKGDLPDHGSMGFCFDSIESDYNIVRVAWPAIEIYSLNADSWRRFECENKELPFYFMEKTCDTIVKGEPHWLAYRDEEPFVAAVCFDVDKQKFFITESPGSRLVTFRNSLAALEKRESEQSGVLKRMVNLWVQDDNYNWSKKLSVECCVAGESPVGSSMSGHIFVALKGGELIVYNSETGEKNRVRVDGAEARTYKVVNYTPSMVQIRGSNQVSKRQ